MGSLGEDKTTNQGWGGGGNSKLGESLGGKMAEKLYFL